MTKVIVSHVDSYVFRREAGGIKYLLLKRRKGKFYGHLWQGVAGHIHESETAAEAVVRELGEETGLDAVRILVVDHVSSFYQDYNDRMNLVPVFGVEVDSYDVQLSREHTEYRWVTIDDALGLLSWNQQKRAIKALHEMLGPNDNRMRWSEVKLQQ